ncbi:hypothetical protein GCM10010440_56140 [Kitasatospora cinereorecta]
MHMQWKPGSESTAIAVLNRTDSAGSPRSTRISPPGPAARTGAARTTRARSNTPSNAIVSSTDRSPPPPAPPTPVAQVPDSTAAPDHPATGFSAAPR